MAPRRRKKVVADDDDGDGDGGGAAAAVADVEAAEDDGDDDDEAVVEADGSDGDGGDGDDAAEDDDEPGAVSQSQRRPAKAKAKGKGKAKGKAKGKRAAAGAKRKRSVAADDDGDGEGEGAGAAAEEESDGDAEGGGVAEEEDDAQPGSQAPAAVRRRRSSAGAAGGAGAAPLRPAKRRRRDEGDDWDDGGAGGPALSQATSAAFARLSAAEIEKLVTDAVRYFLLTNAKKIPVKKADLTKNVLQLKGRASGGTNEIIAEAARRLKAVFGYELHALPKRVEEKKRDITGRGNKAKTGAAAAAAQVTGGGYILRAVATYNAETDDGEELRVLNGAAAEHAPQRGLIMTLLTLLWLSDGVVTEQQLWKCLGEFGLSPQQKEHPLFGSVETYVQQTLVKQQYLERRKEDAAGAVVSAAVEASQAAPDRATYTYRIGARGAAELRRVALYRFAACDVLGQDPDRPTMTELTNQERKEALEHEQQLQALAAGGAAGAAAAAAAGGGAARPARGKGKGQGKRGGRRAAADD